MKYLKQFLIILTISFAGEILHQLLPLPVPAGIYGILLLFALLKTGILPLASVRETACLLVEIMPVMCIPAAVGIMDSWGIIAPSWLEYLTMTVVSTVIVMAVSGLVTQTVLRVRSREVLQEPLQTHSQEPLQTSMYQAGAERKALPEEANADTDAPVPKKEEQSHELTDQDVRLLRRGTFPGDLLPGKLAEEKAEMEISESPAAFHPVYRSSPVGRRRGL